MPAAGSAAVQGGGGVGVGGAAGGGGGGVGGGYGSQVTALAMRPSGLGVVPFLPVLSAHQALALLQSIES